MLAAEALPGGDGGNDGSGDTGACAGSDGGNDGSGGVGAGAGGANTEAVRLSDIQIQRPLVMFLEPSVGIQSQLPLSVVVVVVVVMTIVTTPPAAGILSWGTNTHCPCSIVVVVVVAVVVSGIGAGGGAGGGAGCKAGTGPESVGCGGGVDAALCEPPFVLWGTLPCKNFGPANGL